MKFILTIDTEADNQWVHGSELTTENIQFIPRFQKLCDKFLIKPTYLVTSEICNDSYAKKIFSEYLLFDRAEVGAHLHSWTTPPFLDKDGYKYNDTNHPYASELPESLLNQKIKYLTNQIETSFGQRPLSFRSGRFGFNENVAKVLCENSYLVDSSITPFINWASNKGFYDGKGGPDFTDKTPFPSRYSFSNHSLIEIPVTIIPTKFPFNRNWTIAKLYFKNIEKRSILNMSRKLFYKYQPLWLRPLEWMNINLFEELIDEAFKLKLPYIVMMFHSSELKPGCSIYRKDENSIEQLYDQLESFFNLLKEKNIFSIRLTEAAKNLRIKISSNK